MTEYNQQNGNGRINRDNREKNKFIRVNWKIKSTSCRVLEDGQPSRIMNTRSAIEYAQSIGLDLVEVNFDRQNNMSTAKICDYGKYAYDEKRREKLAKKQARANKADLKCLQMSLTTDTADLERMISHAKEFLENGDKVKIALRFRNRRESSSVDLAKDMMKKVLSRFDGLAVLDSTPCIAGRELYCILRKVK